MSATARACRAGAALIGLVALVIGVPVALIVLVGWPLPAALPAWSSVSASLRGGDLGDEVVIKTLACVVWVAWAQLAVAVVWELAVNVPRLSVGKPQRPAPPLVNHQLGAIAAKIVGAMLVVSIATRSLATSAPLPPQAAITATMPAVEVTPVAPLPILARPSGQPSWMVQPGETLWAITERATGTPDRLGEVMALNADQLTRPRDVRAGMVLRLPPDATVPADRQTRLAVATIPADPEHTVVVGENLWSIADDALRTPADPNPANGEIAPYWLSVIAANSPPIRDPNLIYPGEQIVLPPTPAEEAAAAAPGPAVRHLACGHRPRRPSDAARLCSPGHTPDTGTAVPRALNVVAAGPPDRARPPPPTTPPPAPTKAQSFPAGSPRPGWPARHCWPPGRRSKPAAAAPTGCAGPAVARSCPHPTRRSPRPPWPSPPTPTSTPSIVWTPPCATSPPSTPARYSHDHR